MNRIYFGAGVYGIETASLTYFGKRARDLKLGESAMIAGIIRAPTYFSPFRNLKGDLAIRPVFHQDEKRIEAHIFIAFLAYCMQITLTRRLHALAPGLTARSALEKFAAVQMIDVHLPTTDGREIMLTRYTHPERELQLLIDQLKLRLPPQPPPRITSTAIAQVTRRSEDLLV